MARREKKYHYIYKTTNLKNGRFYVGMHSTDNLNDGYLGSGTKLRRSIRKNGKENFKLEILEFLTDRSSLQFREKELVNEDLLKDPMCMNLIIGGKGGFTLEATKNGRKKTDELLRKKYGENFRSIVSKKFYNNITIEERIEITRKIKEGQIKSNFDWGSTFRGKHHNDLSKRKIGEANSIKQSGSSNSQFGTCWITNGTENKKIKKTDSIPDEWAIGRTINMRK
jgi:hypothetical protein